MDHPDSLQHWPSSSQFRIASAWPSGWCRRAHEAKMPDRIRADLFLIRGDPTGILRAPFQAIIAPPRLLSFSADLSDRIGRLSFRIGHVSSRTSFPRGFGNASPFPPLPFRCDFFSSEEVGTATLNADLSDSTSGIPFAARDSRQARRLGRLRQLGVRSSEVSGRGWEFFVERQVGDARGESRAKECGFNPKRRGAASRWGVGADDSAVLLPGADGLPRVCPVAA